MLGSGNTCGPRGGTSPRKYSNLRFIFPDLSLQAVPLLLETVVTQPQPRRGRLSQLPPRGSGPGQQSTLHHPEAGFPRCAGPCVPCT